MSSQMQDRPFVVVLTGGPSAGKSSAIAMLRDRLGVRGFQVLTVPENATHFLANSDGFQSQWAGTDAQVCMQRIFLDYQFAQEDFFKDFAKLHPSKPGILILDCCTLNGKLYLSNEQWQQVLTLKGKSTLTEDMLFARYDLVIHMVTTAFEGQYEYGPGSNNPGRYHTPEQAKETDDRCLEVFGAHPQLRVVPHFERFDDKIEKVAEFVKDALQIEGLAGKRHKQVVEIISYEDLASVLALESTSVFVVTSTFLDDQLQHSVRKRMKVQCELWLDQFRNREHVGRGDIPEISKHSMDRTYERRTHVREPINSIQDHLVRKCISEEAYYAALDSAVRDAPTSHKCVISFTAETHYYELFFFIGSEESLILDSPLDTGSRIPRWLAVPSVAASISDSPVATCNSETAAGRSKTPDRPVTKRQRVLGRFSTEEAADCFIGLKHQRQFLPM